MVTYEFGPLGKPAYDARAELHEIPRNVVLDCIKEQGEIIDKLRTYGADMNNEDVQGMRNDSMKLLHIFIAVSTLSTEP